MDKLWIAPLVALTAAAALFMRGPQTVAAAPTAEPLPSPRQVVRYRKPCPPCPRRAYYAAQYDQYEDEENVTIAYERYPDE